MTKFFLTSVWVFFLILLTACTTLGETSSKKMAKIHIQLGMNAIETNNNAEAYRQLKSALTLSPYLPEAWYSMAYFYEKRGNDTLANQYYRRAIYYAPWQMDVHNNYGVYLCRKHHYRGAIEQFKQAVNNAGPLEAATVYINAGFCAEKVPNRSLALVYFQQALSHDPESVIAAKQIQRLKP